MYDSHNSYIFEYKIFHIISNFINGFDNNLCKNYRYTPQGAKEVCMYVIDSDLAKKFAVINPKAKILFMSGYVCPSVAHQGMPDSEFAFVQKPFAAKTLVAKMRNVLGGPDGLRDLGKPRKK